MAFNQKLQKSASVLRRRICSLSDVSLILNGNRPFSLKYESSQYENKTSNLLCLASRTSEFIFTSYICCVITFSLSQSREKQKKNQQYIIWYLLTHQYHNSPCCKNIQNCSAYFSKIFLCKTCFNARIWFGSIQKNKNNNDDDDNNNKHLIPIKQQMQRRKDIAKPF